MAAGNKKSYKNNTSKNGTSKNAASKKTVAKNSSKGGSNNRTSAKKNTASKKTSARSKAAIERKAREEELARQKQMRSEIILIVLFAVSASTYSRYICLCRLPILYQMISGGRSSKRLYILALCSSCCPWYFRLYIHRPLSRSRFCTWMGIRTDRAEELYAEEYSLR